MSKEDWEIFMGTKKRTAKSHFSQGRKCSRCGIFIINTSKTGFCQLCWRDHLEGDSYKDRCESPGHTHLKELAVKWLERIGAEKIRKEAGIRTKSKARIIADVAGEYKGKTIIVECGGSTDRKLKKALSITPNVYIWPYHYNKPYLYNPSIVICNLCGNFKGLSRKPYSK